MILTVDNELNGNIHSIEISSELTVNTITGTIVFIFLVGRFIYHYSGRGKLVCKAILYVCAYFCVD